MPVWSKVSTDNPWVRKAPTSSFQIQNAIAGWPLAAVSSSRHRRGSRNGVAARKAATSAPSWRC